MDVVEGRVQAPHRTGQFVLKSLLELQNSTSASQYPLPASRTPSSHIGGGNVVGGGVGGAHVPHRTGQFVLISSLEVQNSASTSQYPPLASRTSWPHSGIVVVDGAIGTVQAPQRIGQFALNSLLSLQKSESASQYPPPMSRTSWPHSGAGNVVGGAVGRTQVPHRTGHIAFSSSLEVQKSASTSQSPWPMSFTPRPHSGTCGVVVVVVVGRTQIPHRTGHMALNSSLSLQKSESASQSPWPMSRTPWPHSGTLRGGVENSPVSPPSSLSVLDPEPEASEGCSLQCPQRLGQTSLRKG